MWTDLTCTSAGQPYPPDAIMPEDREEEEEE